MQRLLIFVTYNFIRLNFRIKNFGIKTLELTVNFLLISKTMPAPKYNSTNPFNNTTHLTHSDTPSSSQTDTACLQTWSRCKHIQAYIKSRPIQLANYTEEQSSSFVENQKPVFVNIYSFNCENNRKQIDGLNMKVYKWIKRESYSVLLWTPGF